MKKAVIATITSTAVLLTVPAAVAQESGELQSEPKGYMGLGIPLIIAQDFCDTGGASVSNWSCDDSQPGFQIFGGVREGNFGAEIGLTGAENYKAGGTVEGVSVASEASFVMAYAAALGRLPLGDEFSLSGKAGMHYWEQEVTVAAAASSRSATSISDDSGFNFLLGAGAEYKPHENFALQAEWVRFFGGGDVDLDAPAVNVVWVF